MIDLPLNPDMFRERLRDLYARHHGFVRQACWRYVQNDEDADDLAHEVLLKAARALETFQGSCSTTTWLYRVALNHCRDAGRARRRRQEANTRFARDPELRTWLTTSSQNPGGYRDPGTRWAGRVLEELRSTFDGPERHIVYLSFDVGMPQNGIARVMGLPRASIARRMAHIRDRACSLYFEEQAQPAHIRIRGITYVRG